MSQRAVFVRVDGVLYDEILGYIPDYDEGRYVCREMGYNEDDDTTSNYLMLEYEWVDIGDGEAGMDDFIPDDALIHLYGSDEFEKKVKEIYGYDVETIETGEMEVWFEDLADEDE